MDYQALYRKYRPQKFGDLVGQDHVSETLSREVEGGTVAHAYLFAGPRGTGKTSTARIIAKALNCTDRRDGGEPCNECASCIGITEGNSLDVIELDAASHNKVEDVREIRANVGTVASVGGSRRVYILDEAHMLSRAASNALLKTLEEPPEHAHFVLATTEPYKLPDTIRSRTQRFDFHPIGSEALIGHLGAIATAEGFSSTPESLSLIARHARGSARDAIGLLEQVAALGSGTVDARGVTRALGLADTEVFTELARVIAERDAPGALSLVTRIASEGSDLRRFVSDSIEFLRGVFLVLYAPNIEEIVDEPGDVLEDWRRAARTLDAGDVFRSIDQLGDALVSLREGREERLVVELTLLRLARPEAATDPASLATRLDRIEERVRWLHDQVRPDPAKDGRPAETSQPIAEPPAAPVLRAVPEPVKPAPVEAAPDTPAEVTRQESVKAPEPPAAEPTPIPPPVKPVVSGADVDTIIQKWPAIISQVRDRAGARRHALFQEALPVAVEDGGLMLEVPANLPFHLDQLQADTRLTEVVEAAIVELLGGSLRVRYRSGNGGTPAVRDETPEADSESATVPDKDDLLEVAAEDDDPISIAREVLGAEPTDG